MQYDRDISQKYCKMKPKLSTVTANLNNKRLIIQGKKITFEIDQKNYNQINNFLWQAIALQATKKKGNFEFELDKEELQHLYGLGKVLKKKEPEKTFNIKKAPSNLKAMSCHAPFAYAICMGLKDEEYRTIPTNIRGWILIHASLAKTSDTYFQDYDIDPKKVERGAIIGAALIEDCLGEPGDWAYMISDYRLFDKPLKGIQGKQIIFWGAKTDFEKQAFDKAWSMID
jgi:hypothetical protein